MNCENKVDTDYKIMTSCGLVYTEPQATTMVFPSENYKENIYTHTEIIKSS